MKHTTRVTTLYGWPVYKDYNGKLRLRYLTAEEEAKLLTVSRQLKNAVATDEHAKP